MALHHAKSGEVVGLQPLGLELKEAKSVAIIKSEHFEVIRLIVRAGMQIPSHDIPGNLTLHCLEGHVEIGLDGGSRELRADEWVYLDGGVPHSVKGIEDSSLLLTIFLVAGKG